MEMSADKSSVMFVLWFILCLLLWCRIIILPLLVRESILFLPRRLFVPALIRLRFRARLDVFLIVLNALGACVLFSLSDSNWAGLWPVLIVANWTALGSVVYAYVRLGDELLRWGSWRRRAKVALGLIFGLNAAWLPTLAIAEVGAGALLGLLLPGHAIMLLAVCLRTAMWPALTLGAPATAIIHLSLVCAISRWAQNTGLDSISAGNAGGGERAGQFGVIRGR
ncbi:MAG: hypothetical protein N2111_08630 [Candidatus Sumerlaeaceae bacterium]|nr:hypothetical protein [Candidatus Sumerlaeaceae bacterium]